MRERGYEKTKGYHLGRIKKGKWNENEQKSKTNQHALGDRPIVFFAVYFRLC